MHPEPSQSSTLRRLDAACAKAMELQLAGQLENARQLYGAILQAAPQHDAANYCLGMLHVQLRHPADSLPYLMTALRAKPEVADYWLGVLEAQLLTGRLDEARSTLRDGCRNGLAGAAVEEFSARLTAANAQARKTTRTRPSTKRLAQAEEKVLMALVERRDFAAAVPLARSLTERFPNRGIGWKILGAFIPCTHGYDQAIAALQTAVRLLPRDPEAQVNLGLTLAKAQRAEEGIVYLRRALAMKPDFAAAHYRLAVALQFLGRFAEAEASLRRGIALRANHVMGDDELSHSHLLFLVSHNADLTADEVFAEHCRYGEYFEGPLRDAWPQHGNDRDPERCLKVGLVSGDLCNHAVATFLEPILVELSQRPSLELHAYYTNPAPDHSSQRLLGNFKTWNIVWSLTDLEFANVVQKDRIDVLIDLSGHTAFNRLPAFARKPAPVQISWIGYPGTTGLRAMDYFLADPYFLPPGQFDRHFTEKLVYLPAQTPFKPEPLAPPVNPLPALAAGYVTFGSFNRPGKLNSATVRLWSQLLLAVPNARMFIAGMDPGGSHRSLIEQFSACGIAADRLEFQARCGILSYLALHHRVDICLDTTPYNGGTTTIHALWMGVPTLSVAGSTPASRSGAAILGQLGLHDFIASSPQEFVAKGSHWCGRVGELAELRAALRDRWERSPRKQADQIAAAFEQALRHMWRGWCANLPAESFQIAGDPAGP